MSEISDAIQTKCLAFGDRIIKLNDYLLKEAANKKPSFKIVKGKRVYEKSVPVYLQSVSALCNQLLRSGTSMVTRTCPLSPYEQDYLLSKETDEQVIENIKKKFLNNCIQENVQNDNIKNVAKRTVWLGNDETHYVRQWEDKDVQYLKKLIDLTVRWIENEIETEQVLQEINK